MDSSSSPLSPDPISNPALFHSTRWTQVRRAQLESPEGRRALSELCAQYYEPVLVFLRIRLRDAERARELSHEFFAELLEGGRIQGAAPAHGKFRSYLLGAVKHFVARQHQAANRFKRGGTTERIPLDSEEALEVSDPGQLSPEEEFDRQWALIVLARSLKTLELRCREDGAGTFFETARPLLAGDCAHGEQVRLAAELGMSPEAFRKALQRLRKQLRETVKEEIAGTLDSGCDVQQELNALLAALSN